MRAQVTCGPATSMYSELPSLKRHVSALVRVGLVHQTPMSIAHCACGVGVVPYLAERCWFSASFW